MDITAANQTLVESYRYSPYGEPTVTRNSQAQSSDPLSQHWGFNARALDEESESYYYRARVLSPVIGRFMQRDPIGFVSGSNLTEYVHSSPTNRTDPSGEIEAGPDCDDPCKQPGRPPARGMEWRRPLGEGNCSPCNTYQWCEAPPKPWWYDLPRCPRVKPARTNSAWCSEGANSYHPGAAVCYRQTGRGGQAGQQCCYDASGNLITEGPGAGTPDMASPGGSADSDGDCSYGLGNAWDIFLHFVRDVMAAIGGPGSDHRSHPPSGSAEERVQRDRYERGR
jgi:RHS repeat-associated protein